MSQQSTQSGSNPSSAHEEFEILMMGALDGELSQGEQASLQSHLQGCASCSQKLAQYRHLVDLTDSLRLEEPQDYELDRFWNTLYNRMERRSAWWFLVIGVVGVTSALMFEVFRTDLLAWWLKAGLGLVATGFLLLFVSVLRVRLRTLPYDRYREVHR